MKDKIDLDDFKIAGDKGGHDWAGYRKALVANGERCKKCDAYIFGKTVGFPTLCSDCESMEKDDGEVTHDDYVRCPACGECWSPRDSDDYELYDDGEHDVTCGYCGEEFEVTTHVSHTFTSPEKKTKNKVEEGEDDV